MLRDPQSTFFCSVTMHALPGGSREILRDGPTRNAANNPALYSMVYDIPTCSANNANTDTLLQRI